MNVIAAAPYVYLELNDVSPALTMDVRTLTNVVPYRGCPLVMWDRHTRDLVCKAVTRRQTANMNAFPHAQLSSYIRQPLNNLFL